ncbi:peptidoglycan D,D-transpeptidase FtsI family protein [Candidatus Vallotia lariciata]|uniref:peptidoglycan D,D-transpeptidase FtsI family protein n=1 Tax=Candidatus Vallotia laricis TaxID=2018052 RepID=UPI001D0126DE|nr:penicillin-binding protein 2 [Candidatus Vallotia lariciata]UDG82787.1 putative peptidoglycan D,D-transpeptidase PenA [Candidatus Vallotia lariciata]
MKILTHHRHCVPFSLTPSLWRSRLVVFLLFIAFIVIVARAFWIQVLSNAFYRKQGESRYQSTVELPATRGKILDRNGLILAISVPVRAIWAIPQSIPYNLSPNKLTDLSKLLSMNEKKLREKLSQDKTFVYVKRQVPLKIAQKIAALNIPGLYARPEYKRFYPEGEIISHMIGFTNVENEGQEGIELEDQKELSGITGSRHVIKDRIGHIIEDIDELIKPCNGLDITLSLDIKTQYIAFTQLKSAVNQFKAKAGSAIVIDVKTGEVLALVNYPTYNPNDRSHITSQQLRNRVLTDVFEPGSIMKPFTISLALDLHRVSPTTLIDIGSGRFTLDGETITDETNVGSLTVGGIIQKSSNIGITKISMRLRPEEIWNMYTSIGFGKAPKVDFPGAATGQLHPWQRWRRIEQATMSYGYGLSASLFQLSQAYTAIAHDGCIIPLTLIRSKGNDAPKSVQIFSTTTARQVQLMLETVTQSGGTSPGAAVPGYRVGGKSGTAYKHVGWGYDRSKYRASFIGMAPIPHPRIIVAVSIDEPTVGSHFGGRVSAPVFSVIVKDTLRLLNIPPDIKENKLIVNRNSKFVLNAGASENTMQ